MVEAQIIALRRDRRLGTARIAAVLGLAPSTGYRVLTRHGMPRLEQDCNRAKLEAWWLGAVQGCTGGRCAEQECDNPCDRQDAASEGDVTRVVV
jgi:hypothetical protein